MSTVRRRRREQDAQWPLDAGITIVLFAGLGGACAGLEDAGCPVHVANNHDAVALAAHQALHPHTRHVRGDIFDVDPVVATGGRRVKILWASPDCRDHSVAKGGAPRSPRVRSLPWQVCRWAGKTRPEVIMMENVREIRGWGPVIAKRDQATGRVIKLDGTVAARGERVPVREQQLVRDRRHLGRSYRQFVAHLQGQGYDYEDRDLNCADYGVPTARRRWFAVARRDGLPIAWPARTHAPANDADQFGLAPHVAAATIIDWTLPMPSIFERTRSLADATCRRIATGLQRFVLDNPRPYLVSMTHKGSDRVHDSRRPLPTVTTAHRGEIAVVAPTIVRTNKTAASNALGAWPPVEPLRTNTTSGQFAVTAAHLTMFNENSIGQDLEEPLKTVMAGAPRFGVCAASLVQTGYGEREGQAPRAQDIELPIGTQVAGGSKHAVVAAWLAQHNGGMVGHHATDPLSTMTAGVAQQQVVSAWLAQHNGDQVGHAAQEPLSTMSTRITQQQVACGYLAHLRGSSPSRTPADPLPTLTAGGGHVAAVAAFMVKYYGQGSVHQGVDEPLHTQTGRMRHGVVTAMVEGLPYVVADIGMRMLEPHEAAAAHELRLPAEIVIDGKRRPLTKTEAMRLVGNSVPKRMARLLAEANIVHALASREVAA